jgi:hypothetical protein
LFLVLKEEFSKKEDLGELHPIYAGVVVETLHFT